MENLLKTTLRGGKNLGIAIVAGSAIRRLVQTKQGEAAAKALKQHLRPGLYSLKVNEGATHAVFTTETTIIKPFPGARERPGTIVRIQLVALPKHEGKVVKLPFGGVRYPITEKRIERPKGKVTERPRR
ncbi:MAG: hypothetical protein V1722_02740 [Candidatus Micrarchaeota archaeon]